MSETIEQRLKRAGEMLSVSERARYVLHYREDVPKLLYPPTDPNLWDAANRAYRAEYQLARAVESEEYRKGLLIQQAVHELTDEAVLDFLRGPMKQELDHPDQWTANRLRCYIHGLLTPDDPPVITG